MYKIIMLFVLLFSMSIASSDVNNYITQNVSIENITQAITQNITYQNITNQNGTISNGTYIGDGTDDRPIAHGLGVIPKAISIQLSNGDMLFSNTDTLWSSNSGTWCNTLSKNNTYFYVQSSTCGTNNIGITYDWIAIGGTLNSVSVGNASYPIDLSNVSQVSNQLPFAYISGAEPSISQGVYPKLWVYNKTFQNLTTDWITEGSNLFFTTAKAISAVQSILDSINITISNIQNNETGYDKLDGTRSWTGDYNASGKNLTNIYDILGQGGVYFLKNTSILCSSNCTITRYENGSILIDPSGTGGGITNDTVQITPSQVTGQNGIDASQNQSITGLQNNDSYFNGSGFPNSTNFRNDSLQVAIDTKQPIGNYVLTNNASYVLTSNGSYVLTNNESYVLTNNGSYVLTSNTSYVKTDNTSYVLITNTSYVKTDNSSYVLVTNTSYVLTNNGSYVLTSNNSYVLTNNASYALLASPIFTGTVTIPTPFTLGAISVTTTGTELNYVSGVTSAIQTQLNGKQASGSYETTSNKSTDTALGVSDILYPSQNAVKTFVLGQGFLTSETNWNNNYTAFQTHVSNSTVNPQNMNASNISSGTLPAERYSTYNSSYDAKGNASYPLDINSSTQFSVTNMNSSAASGYCSSCHVFVQTSNTSYITIGTLNTTMDKSTTNLTEGSNLFFTTARVRTNISNGTSGNLTYNSSTGVFNFNTTSCNDAVNSKLLSDGTNISCGTDQNSGGSLTNASVNPWYVNPNNISGLNNTIQLNSYSQVTGFNTTVQGVINTNTASFITNTTMDKNYSNMTSIPTDFNNATVNNANRTDFSVSCFLDGGGSVALNGSTCVYSIPVYASIYEVHFAAEINTSTNWTISKATKPTESLAPTFSNIAFENNSNIAYHTNASMSIVVAKDDLIKFRMDSNNNATLPGLYIDMRRT